ncbi:MAG: lipoate--protein ligase [Actinomycetota bacterium]|nr:lipoate--protein ligase [Actinomycetota bacterium]
MESHRVSQGRPIRLLRESFPDRPGLDTAVSRVLLQRASRGEVGETLRIHRPGAIVAFGRQDVVSDGYPEAVAAARRGGFQAVERLAGGRAAVFHEDTVAFSWCIPEEEPRQSIQRRFLDLGEVVLAALKALGVDARPGQVPGEYCPGTYSVNARGQKKIMGVGQRLAQRSAHVGGVVVVRGSERVRKILVPVYAALGVDWDERTVGSIEDEVGPIGYQAAEQALLDEFAARFHLEEGHLDQATLELARSLEPHHLSPG